MPRFVQRPSPGSVREPGAGVGTGMWREGMGGQGFNYPSGLKLTPGDPPGEEGKREGRKTVEAERVGEKEK